MSLVAFVGFKGAGKNTAALPLIQAGYHALSFADALKDALAAIFCWPRHMLEGDTLESRLWRETVDVWWSAQLGIPDFSPRRAMQLVGTDAMRHHFHPEVWILHIERRISLLPPGSNVVLIDGRFPNEIDMARRLGGTVARIKKGPEPDWFFWAHTANRTAPGTEDHAFAMANMQKTGVHSSEWAWVGSAMDQTFENDDSVEHLHDAVRRAYLG